MDAAFVYWVLAIVEAPKQAPAHTVPVVAPRRG